MRYLKTYTLFEGVNTKIILPAINERKSDKISMELSRFVVSQFKKREDFVMNGISFERGDEYATFDLGCVFIEDSDFNHPFSINASSDSESLDLEVTFREKDFPKYMNDFVAEIKETIEHEIEHIEQQNFEDMEVSYNYDSEDDDNYKYLTSNQEIPAYVRGLIKRAKTKRITLSAAMDEWFEENKLKFEDPDEEWPIVKNMWMEEANKRVGHYKKFKCMKHLKKYFESMADLAGDSYNKRQERLRTLEDMSLDLWDENFNVQVGSEVLSRDDKYIKVNIHKKSEPSPLGMYGAPRFDYNKIKDTLLSMVSYMESEGYSIRDIEVSDKYVHNTIPVELKEEELYLKYKPEVKVNYPIGQLVIKFKE